MNISKFIHLRVKSCFSLLESSIKIDALINSAKKHSMPAVAITDNENMFSALEFSVKAVREGIQPLNGLIVNVLYDDQDYKESGELLFLVKDQKGYENILKISTEIHLSSDKNGFINWDFIKDHNQGLIMLSSYDEGIIGKNIYRKKYDIAKLFAEEGKEVFGDRFYMEIMRSGTKVQNLIEHDFVSLSKDLDIPLVATNNVLFLAKEEYDEHDTLLCIAQNCHKEETERFRVSEKSYFVPSSEMESMFYDIPEALQNSINIAKRCSYFALPNQPMLPKFIDGKENEYLVEQSRNGLEKRIDKIISRSPNIIREEIEKKYLERLTFELNIICKMNFAGYFLIVADFICWAKDTKIIVGPGRGSGAGSLVAWSLGITDIDPIDFGLFFERFLNPDRVSMPDFDIDFCQKRRDEVIGYVKQKYGKERVAHIITFGSMQAKAVVKDVSRVLGLRFDISNYITELIPFNAVNPVTLKQALIEVVELNSASKGHGLYNIEIREYETESEVNSLIKRVLDTGLLLEGLPRHISVHAAGIVIGSCELLKILPLYKDSRNGEVITQYSMKYTELVGLVKFDFLGLQTLTLIDNIINSLQEEDIYLDLELVSLEDRDVFQLFSEGKTNGVFQFESPGMKDSLRKLKPDCIEDLMALTSLYRPGPMDNIPSYIDCKKGLTAPNYLHPLLEDTLKETYGVIIYQEQVMKIAQILAGYTLAEADLLRRAMGKKIKSEMQSQEQMFLNGAVKNNVSQEKAKEIFELVAKFAGYGFNKSHAAAYSMISYHTAYLKRYYPINFLISCLNLELNDSHKIAHFIQEAKDFGINIFPPDINLSNSYFKKQDNSIIYAFAAIKSVTAEFGKKVEQERIENGYFTSIFDFIERIGIKNINRKLLENLILSGCFDSLLENRNTLFNSIEMLIAHANLHEQEKQTQQFSLIKPNYDNILAKKEEWQIFHKLDKEFDCLGAYISDHPLYYYGDQIKNCHNSKNIYNLEYGIHTIEIAGILVKKDSRMSGSRVFVSMIISDICGYSNVTIFHEEVLKDYAHLLYIKSHILLKCEARRDEGGVRLSVFAIQKIPSVISLNSFTIRLLSIEYLSKIYSLFENKTEGEQIIYLEIPVKEGFYIKSEIRNISISFEEIELLKKQNGIKLFF